ncbi:MAG: hypothetical protein PUJ39_05150 [Eubacteriales bacterium]|nr:hypothetical protein [Eubacteriales bacterium]
MSQTFQPALRPQSRSLQKRNTATGWLFILPNLIGFCAFTLAAFSVGCADDAAESLFRFSC